MAYTFPNQKMVTVHREVPKTDFLGIKNENWQSAARDLGPYALMLYLYFASNANNYTLALSPVAVRQAVGMAQSTYRDQVDKLIDKGYLVPNGGNSFDFYEVPQARPAVIQKNNQSAVLNFEECTSAADDKKSDAISTTVDIREINNSEIPNRRRTHISGLEITDEVKIPEVKEVRIARPTAEPKKTLTPKPERTGFVF